MDYSAYRSARALLPMPLARAGVRQDLGYELAVAALRAADFTTQAMAVTPDSGAMLEMAQAEYPAGLVYLHIPSRKAFRTGVGLLQALSSASPSSILLAGGAFASDHAGEILEAAQLLDGVVAGEAEGTLMAVARALAEGRSWWQEPGLWHRRTGAVEKNPPRLPIEDLDILPRAARDFLQTGETARRQILLSRGCDSDCSYCTMQVPEREAFPARQRFWRTRSPRAVVDEIEDLWRREGIVSFSFHSFVFFGYDQVGTQVVEEIAREILSRELPIRFSFVTHPGHLRRNLHLLPLLRQAGLESIYLGVDSILERARSLYRLPFDREDALASLMALHEAEIQFQTGYIFYDPYTTLDEITENLSFWRAVRPLYGHLRAPYALLLHHQIVNTFLTLSARMPVVKRLRSHGLLLQEGNLEGPPVARFLHRSAGRFAHLHRRFNQEVLRPLAPIVFHPALEQRHPYLADFLIEALETLRHQVTADPEGKDDEVLRWMRDWSRETLAPAQGICAGSGVLPTEHQISAS